MDRAALEFGESHPDLRIVIFNPSMILGKNFRESLQSNLGIWKANADLDCYAATQNLVISMQFVATQEKGNAKIRTRFASVALG